MLKSHHCAGLFILVDLEPESGKHIHMLLDVFSGYETYPDGVSK